MYWPLGLLVAASALPLSWSAGGSSAPTSSASRRMQDQQGDLATLVEESAQGLRDDQGVRPAAAHGRAVRGRRARGCTTRPSARAGCSPARPALFDLVPNLTLAAVLVAGAVAAATGDLTLGELVAFVTLQLMLIWPVESLGLDHRQRPGGDDRRRPDLRGARHRTGDRGPAGRGRRAAVRLPRRASGSSDVTFTYPGAPAPVLRGIDLERAAGRDAGHRRRHRLRQDHARLAGAPAVRRDRRADHARRARPARHHARLAAPRSSASRSRSRRCSRCRCGRT